MSSQVTVTFSERAPSKASRVELYDGCVLLVAEIRDGDRYDRDRPVLTVANYNGYEPISRVAWRSFVASVDNMIKDWDLK